MADAIVVMVKVGRGKYDVVTLVEASHVPLAEERVFSPANRPFPLNRPSIKFASLSILLKYLINSIESVLLSYTHETRHIHS